MCTKKMMKKNKIQHGEEPHQLDKWCHLVIDLVHLVTKDLDPPKELLAKEDMRVVEKLILK